MATSSVLFTWIIYILIALPRESDCGEQVPMPIGCQRTDANDPAMNDIVHEDKLNMNQELCIDYCAFNEMTFAGLQNGYECRCSDAFPKYEKLDPLHCKKICVGNRAEYCGGSDAITAFAVCDEGHYGPRCDLPCMCLHNAVCNFMTGVCPDKCQPGWRGKRCDDVIPEEKSGIRVFVDNIVEKIMALGGRIKSFFVVEKGSAPPKKCEPGLYGLVCKSECHCKPGSNCDRLTGVCNTPECGQGWLGKRCDKPNPCSSKPCDNNGECRLNSFYMHCDCPNGYSGVNCESVDPCFKNPCLNGARCLSNATSFKCECKDDFSGILCDIDTSSLPNNATYLGCYRESTEEREFPTQMDLSSSSMEPKACARRCKARLFTYAALQGGNKCYCGKTYAQYGGLHEKYCNMPCEGAKDVKCGADKENSVYSVCPIGFYNVDCKGICNCFGAQCDLYSGICPSPHCKVGFFGEKCDQAKFETAETFSISRQYITYGVGVLAGIAVLQVLGLFGMTFGNSSGGDEKAKEKKPKKIDVDGQKQELEALLAEESKLLKSEKPDSNEA